MASKRIESVELSDFSSKSVKDRETTDSDGMDEPRERHAIVDHRTKRSALYTGEARAVEGSERPVISAYKSLRQWYRSGSTLSDAPSFRAAVSALAMLFFVYTLNQADRWVLPVVIPAGLRCHLTGDNCTVKNETAVICDGDCIDFGDYDQGILTGPAFCAVYVVSGIPLAYLADTQSRTLVLAVGMAFWSLMVLGTGFVQNTWQLYLTRMGLGIGEATCSPVAFSLLSDYFPRQHRALALSIYSSGVYWGGSIGYFCGAINKILCWRWTFRMFGIIGLAALPFVFIFLKNPKSQKEDHTIRVHQEKAKSSYTLKETALLLVKERVFILLITAASVRNVAGYALGGWLPTFFRVEYNQSSEDYGVRVALVVLFGGLPGSIIGGLLADKLTKRGGAHWKAYVIALSQVLAAPAIAVTLIMPNAQASYGMLFIAYLTAETWLGCAAAIVQDVMFPAIRCQASAVYIAITTIVGCIGPVVISAILSHQDPCHPNYKNALLFVVPTCYLASAILFAITGIVLHRSQKAMGDKENIVLTKHDVLADEFSQGESCVSDLDHR